VKRLIIGAILAATIAWLPAITSAHGGTDVTVSGHPHPGGPIEIVGEDFAANDVVRIELRKDGAEPSELGRIPADEDGGFTVTLHIPASVAPGLYELAAEGQKSATFEVTILDPPAGSAVAAEPAAAAGSASNNRPAGETLGLAVFTAAIALAAVGLLWASRTHAHSAGA
jgi:hypothetical protein